MLDALIEPFTYSYMQRGLAAGALVGIACAVLGAFVVLRGMAFVGDAIAHTVLPGIVIAYLNGANLFIGALVAGIVTALGIGWITRDGEIAEDTAIGVIFSGLFALGVLLLSTVNSYRDLTHILFGNILGVTDSDLLITLGVTASVLVAVYLVYKELVVASFDAGHASVIGLSPSRVRYGLLVLLSLTVVSGIQTVGVVMVAALLVTPAATASLLTKRLPLTMLIGAVLCMAAVIVGLYASYYAGVASGAAIVLSLTSFFLVAFLFSPGRGLLTRRVRKS
jgi:ABC-type Mn2+/Zn2+ transport system permease subunit